MKGASRGAPQLTRVSTTGGAPHGSRPAAVLDVAATPEALLKVTQRLNGMYWKGRTLVVQTTTAR